MQGLLDIWNNYWDENKKKRWEDTWGSQETDMDVSYDNNQVFVAPGKRYKIESTGKQVKVPKKDPWYKRFQDSPGMTTAGGAGDISGEAADPQTVGQKTSSMVLPFYNTKTKKVENRVPNSLTVKQDTHLIPPKWDSNKKKYVVQKQDTSKNFNTKPFHPSQGDLKYHGNEQDQLKWWEVLANKMGIDFDKAAANWKEKGGFEGLMANPAFTMGLAFMQAGAEGKTIGQGALDNVMKAAGISSHYKKILKDRKQEPIQATAVDIDEVKSLLKTMNVDDPGWHEKLWGKLKGKNVQMKFDIAAEDIAVELQKEMKRMSDNNPNPDKPLVFDTRLKLKIIKRLLKEGKFQKKGGTWFTAGTLESDVGGSFPKPINMATGGPIQAGQPYVVGEEGPEVIIPHSSGNVLSNDDSQIYAMLLAANPQLQKVSKARAERILRSRFPEYFE
jgi:hypothetical protein